MTAVKISQEHYSIEYIKEHSLVEGNIIIKKKKTRAHICRAELLNWARSRAQNRARSRASNGGALREGVSKPQIIYRQYFEVSDSILKTHSVEIGCRL